MTENGLHLLFLFLGVVTFIIYPPSAMFVAGLWTGVAIFSDPIESENHETR